MSSSGGTRRCLPRYSVAIPYNYGQPSSSTGAVSLAPLRNLFQWSNDEEEASGYASSASIGWVRMEVVSANMADNNDDDLRRRIEPQEQTSGLSKKP